MLVSSNWKKLLEQNKVAPPANPAYKPKKFQNRSSSSSSSSPSPSSSLTSPVTPLLSSFLAIDCEMVGSGESGSIDCLARCSLINSSGQVLYDRYVQPPTSLLPITDYRTSVSGIQPHHLLPPLAVPFHECRHHVSTLLSGRILVGHSLGSDLSALQLDHPPHLVRDTARYKPFCPLRPRSLKVLAQEKLGLVIQEGKHDSVEDARVVLSLYKLVRKEWEASPALKGKRDKAKKEEQANKKAAEKEIERQKQKERELENKKEKKEKKNKRKATTEVEGESDQDQETEVNQSVQKKGKVKWKSEDVDDSDSDDEHDSYEKERKRRENEKAMYIGTSRNAQKRQRRNKR